MLTRVTPATDLQLEFQHYVVTSKDGFVGIIYDYRNRYLKTVVFNL